MELTVLMAADILVIILVTQTVRQALRLPTPEAAAGRPVMDVIQRPVIILINLVVAHHTNMIPQTAMVFYQVVNVAANTTNATNAAPISETFIVATERLSELSLQMDWLSVWTKNICRIGDLTTIH